MAGKYEAEGPGIHHWATRRNVYVAALVVGGVTLAGFITYGALTIEQVETFIDLAIRLVGILAGIATLVTAALANANVKPPTLGPTRRAED